ncbi:pentachlorophenol monooxygenase [Arthrobacter sp. PAMC25564]|uniref:FAD-dependent monooxygenase n=1 Tax=Arthrobacter sp. PAMC25564 TaxID=2565366 RepID=UPI0010A231C7|nr:FAD-dependent monooxygenase [Arthrobacter sp. PAMC25564]QCB97974.1 pentachlorophenol monooxygenase [Arthrobacter sp. PAMC25564]
MTSASLPVIVIGNGPVGQTTALLLARWHIPVVRLDSRPARDNVGSKAIAQQRDVLDIWETVGVGTRLAEEGVTFRIGRTYFKDKELFSVELQDGPGASPFPPFVNISQQRTEELMDGQIAEQPLIDVRWGHRVTAINQDDSGVTVTCETADGSVDLAGAYAVACPGARGEELRQMLGVTLDGHTFGDRFLITDLRVNMPDWANERRFYFDPPWNPGRQVLIHECPDSTYRVDWQVPEGYDIEEQERTGGLDALIRQVVDDRDYEIAWKSVYRFHARVVDRMRVGKVLIAGDGAHLVAPFGGRGLNSGVPDAENAAWKLAYVLHGWAPEALLETYHEERRAAALENLAVVGETMKFLVPQTADDRDFRTATLERAMTDTSVVRDINSGRMSEPFWYVDSPLTTQDGQRPFPGRPEMGKTPAPAPGILVPDCAITFNKPGVTRLRQIVRDGFTVLTGAAVDAVALAADVTSAAGPVRVLQIEALSPDLAHLLAARPDEVWVVRPDGYVAAVLVAPAASDVNAAIDRAVARPTASLVLTHLGGGDQRA